MTRPDDRPSLEEMYLQIADVVSLRATCDRLHVGCVITDWELTTILSVGYNGAARGLPNGCQRPNEPGNCGCVLHAEVNALLKAPYVNYGWQRLFCTHLPCVNCAYALGNSRVRAVYFSYRHRSDDSIKVFTDLKIQVFEPDPKVGRGEFRQIA